jgi:hypothetical protein
MSEIRFQTMTGAAVFRFIRDEARVAVGACLPWQARRECNDGRLAQRGYRARLARPAAGMLPEPGDRQASPSRKDE